MKWNDNFNVKWRSFLVIFVWSVWEYKSTFLRYLYENKFTVEHKKNTKKNSCSSGFRTRTSKKFKILPWHYPFAIIFFLKNKLPACVNPNTCKFLKKIMCSRSFSTTIDLKRDKKSRVFRYFHFKHSIKPCLIKTKDIHTRCGRFSSICVL